jgi:hypothetical protein
MVMGIDSVGALTSFNWGAFLTTPYQHWVTWMCCFYLVLLVRGGWYNGTGDVGRMKEVLYLGVGQLAATGWEANHCLHE